MFLGTLFNVKINWELYFIALVSLFALDPTISIWRFFAYSIALHQFMLVFYSLNHIIPIRYMAGVLAAIQYLVGPANAYGGLDEQMFDKYRMQVPEDVYFTYALPAVVLFIVGLHFLGKPTGEIIQRKKIYDFVLENPNISYVLIIIGFLSSTISTFFPSSVQAVFYFLSSFKFIGVFILLLGTKQIQTWVLIVVFGSIVLSSIRQAMFHDLVTWGVFLGAVLAIKYKPSFNFKLLTTIGVMLALVIVQQIKGVYRSNISGYGEGNIEEFQESITTIKEGGGLFDLSRMANSNVRINQGFIVTYAMNHIPEKEPFAEGKELWIILEAAFLPRIIAPNKLKAGDNDFVYKYTGMAIREGTSMSISALGDGYVNFGALGGCLFMFFWGLTFNLTLNFFQRWSRKFPIILLFAPMVFYYPIRPDTALQTGLGHMLKATFLIWVVFEFFGYYFRVRKNRSKLNQWKRDRSAKPKLSTEANYS